MKVSREFIYGIIVGVVVLFIFNFLFNAKKTTSTYTAADFPDSLSMTEAMKKYQDSLASYSQELTAVLTQARKDLKSVDELITIANEFADRSNATNKAFAAYQIRNMPTGSPNSPMPAQ